MRRLILGALAAVLLLAGSAQAATLGWSKPVALTSSGQISSLTCETATFCTSIVGPVGGTQTATSFNPSTPSQQTRVVIGDADGQLFCASADRCLVPTTAADTEVGTTDVSSFDPADPSVPVTTVFENLDARYDSFACADDSECVLASYGNGMTSLTPFDPATGTPTATADSVPGFDQPGPLACPSESQCTLSYGSGNVLTFDPETVGTTGAPPAQPVGSYVNVLQCFSTTQCVAVTNAPTAIVFDPQDLSTAVTQALPTHAYDPSCASVNFCLSTDQTTSVVTGDPQSSAPWTAAPFPGGTPGLTACATATLCLATSGSDVLIGTPAPAATVLTTGRATVGAVAPVRTGLTVKLRCIGATTARCSFHLNLAAGISSGPAAAKTVTLKPGLDTVRLGLVSRAQKLLDRDHQLSGELTVSQIIAGAPSIVLAKRKVTLFDASR